MRSRFRLSLLALAVLLAPRGAMAEPIGPHVYAVPFVGTTIFDGSFRFAGGTLRDEPNFGGRVGYQWRNWMGVEAAGGFTPSKVDATPTEKVKMVHGSLDLVFSPYANRVGGPFLLVGGGATKLKASGTPAGSISLNQGNLVVGGGLKFWLSDAMAIRVEARDLNWLGKDKMTKPLAHTLILGAGLEFAFGGKPRDTDGDGVNDKLDQCPNTPTGARVDAKGCPIDSDGDGVFDGLDQCPDTPKGATIDAKGCPSDADGDGVPDGIDTCPDSPKGATVDEKGCTKDSDGDGVLDGIDQCPDTPKGATINEMGCPTDSDKDGVYDGLDKCPDTPAGAKVDKDGCPIELIERETELLDTGMIRIQNINFETGKADLPPEFLPQLDVVGQLLTKWPELKIEVGGHTDSRGSNAYNQKLSQARVDSTLAYVLRKFPNLKHDSFSTKGYGESKPLVPNTNALNMSKNRRVEFKVLNTDVLKHEVEQRKLQSK